MLTRLGLTSLLSLFFVFLSSSVTAQLLSDDVLIRPSLSGYSPVSYFTMGIPQLGSAEYAVTHKGKRYHLTSSEQVKLFGRDPDKYMPRHEACTFSLAQGMVRPADPTKFKIVDGSLLLFYLDDEKDALMEWNESPLGEAELLERADDNAHLIDF